MSEMGGVDAGPLYVDVVANTTGFGRGLQEKINAEVARVKASISAEIDQRKLDAQLAAIERKNHQIAVGVTIDDAKANAQLAAIERKNHQISLGVAIDDAKAEAQLAVIERKQHQVTLGVAVDDAKAQAQLAVIERKNHQTTLGVTVDDAKAEAELAAVAAKRRETEISVTVNAAKAEVQLAAIAAKQRTITINAEIEDAKAEAELERVAAKRRIAQIQAEADTLNAERKLAEAARNRTAKIDVDTSSLDKISSTLGGIGSSIQGVGTSAVGLLQFPAIAAGIVMAAQALAQVASGLISVAAAAAPAVGVLGAIPGLVAGAAQGIGSVVVGFMGIGAAVKASDAAQAQSGAQASAVAAQRTAAAARIAAAQDAVKQADVSLANTEANAARQVEQAQQAVVSAHRQGAQAIASAQQAVSTAVQTTAQNVVSAEQQVATAQRDATQAQLDLVAARQAATRQLQDMNNQLVDQNFTVRQAQLDVQTTGQAREKVYQSPTSTSVQKQQADLTYEEAVQRLKEEQLQQQRLQGDTEKANKAGVEGSSQVVAARQKVQDTTQKLIDAETHLRQVRVDGARTVAAAEAALQRAREDAAVKNAQAAANLANAERTSAFSVQAAQHQVLLAHRNLAAAQAAGTVQAVKQTAANTALATAMNALSPAGRSFATFLTGTLMPAWKGVQKAVQQALLPPVQQGLTALMPLLGVLRTGMVQTATTIGGAFARLSQQYLATPLFKRDLASIMATNNRAFAILATALIPLARALTDVTVVSGPLLLRFAQFVATGVKMVAGFIDAQRASGGLSKFFQLAGDTAAQLWRIARDLVVAIFNIGKAAYPAGRVLLSAFEDVVAKWRGWTGSMKGQNAMKDYFMQAVPTILALGRLIHDIVVDFFNLGNNKQFAGMIDAIRTQILPLLFKVGQNLSGAFGPHLFKLILDVVNLIGTLTSGGSGGALTTFVDTLDLMVRYINQAANSKIGGEILRWISAFAGVAAAAALVVGPLVRIFGIVWKVGGLFLAAGPWGWVILGIAAAVAGVIYAYNHFQTFHDIVNAALHAVGQAAIWLWKNAIIPAFNGIMVAARAVGSAAAWLWTHAIGPAFSAIVTAAKAVGVAAAWLWTNAVRPAFAAMGTFISWWWTNVSKPILTALVNFVRQVIAPAISWLWTQIWRPVLTWMGAFIQWWWNNITKPAFAALVWYFQHVMAPVITWLWNNIVKPTFTIMGTFIKGAVALITGIINGLNWFLRTVIGPTIAWLFDHMVKPYFTAMGTIISNVWNKVISPAFSALKTGLGKVRDAFQTAVAAIGKIWDTLKAAVTAPVRFVIDTIYNNGIRALWNKVAGLVHLPQLSPLYVSGINGVASGTSSAGRQSGGRQQTAMARGGVLPGYAPGVDVINAVLSPGEGVLVPEAVRGLAQVMGTSAEHAIQAINSTFSPRVSKPSGQQQRRRTTSSGLPGFDIGGVFSWIGNQIGKGASTAKSFVGNELGAIGNALKDLVAGALSGPLHAAAGPLHALINRVLPSSPPFVNVMRGVVNSLVDKGVDFISNKDATENAPAMGSGPAAKWQQLWAIVHGAFPNAQLFSSYRPGAITVSGNQSYHALGEAIDVTPSMAIFNWLASHYPRTAELIFSPAGNRQIKNGSPYYYTGAVRAEHFNHVHWALGAALGGGGGGGAVPGGSGVSRWGPMVKQALSALGLSAAPGMVAKVLRQIATESGGNPGITQQIHDVNSGGNEARGLLQVIPPTFRAYHVPGTSNNIFDPWANIMAALNYAMHRYGRSLSALGQGHGYSLGGVVPAVMRMATGGVAPASASAHAAHLAHLAHLRHLAHVQHLAQIARQVVTARPRTTIVKHPAPHPAPPPAHPLISRLFSSGDTGRQLLDGVISTGSKVAAPVVAAINTRLHSSGDTGQALLDALAAMNGRLFDSGGILRPGTTLATNATGQNEYILTGPQWDAVSSLAASAAVSRAVAHEPTAAERLAGAQIQIDVHPQPGTDAREVAREVAVEMGWLLR